MVASSAESSISDYSIFASPGFDPNEYANSILAGDTYPPTKQKTGARNAEAGKEDISVALGKLSFGIEDVAQQLRQVVATHHETLLAEASSVHQLETSLLSVRHGLGEINGSLEKLRLKIRIPYQNLNAHVNRLQRLQLASDVLRRTSRFVLVARRLEVQMAELEKASGVSNQSSIKVAPGTDTPIDAEIGPEGERDRTVAKAALSIAELTALSQADLPAEASQDDQQDAIIPKPIPLHSINAISSHLSAIDGARAKIISEMDIMMQNGLKELNRSQLASALQTAHNLRVLPQLVQDVLDEVIAYVEDRIRHAFDLAKLSKEAGAKESPATPSSLLYKSRVRTEPTNATAPQWATALWTRLEIMIEELASSCIQVYTLEKVLKLKKDSITKAPFLDEAMKVLESKPSSTFWMTTARMLETQTKDAAKSSPFFQQTLSNGYPRLLRLFHDFFSKVAVHTDTVYSQSQQSPETVLILRSTMTFESLYLSRSANRLNESVGTALSGGIRAPPSMPEGIAVARTVINELDSARFDPLLVRSVAKNVASALDMFVQRIDTIVVRDRTATTLIGPNVSAQLALNAQLVSALYNCWAKLNKLDAEYHSSVVSVINPSVESLKRAYEKIVDPLFMSIRRDLSSIIARLNRVDFGKDADPMAGAGGASSYMSELAEKLSFIRSEVFGRFSVGDLMKEWVVTTVKRVIRTFILHASIAKPLSETGKLQLTTDMTELEFALNAFMMEGGNKIKSDLIADDYRALRTFRCDLTILSYKRRLIVL
ncbi:hypothetical protein FRC02_011429 [Tulasnella sp. 418]|nr:hypothetical protein FRC02_011429 [Tulasnella sp. 418]